MSDDIPPLIYPDDEHLKLINSVANELARLYHPDVTRDDITQELWIFWIESWKYLSRYVYDEDEKRGMAKLRKSLHNAASSYCWREKAAARGYQPEDVFFYSKSSLRELLPFVGDILSASSYAVQGERTGRSNKPAHEGGDALAMAADLHRGWEMLKQDARDLLWAAIVEPISDSPYATIGEQEGVTEHAIEARVDRALGQLQNVLGGPRPVVRRQAMSNAQAQAMTRADYGGE